MCIEPQKKVVVDSSLYWVGPKRFETRGTLGESRNIPSRESSFWQCPWVEFLVARYFHESEPPQGPKRVKPPLLAHIGALNTHITPEYAMKPPLSTNLDHVVIPRQRVVRRAPVGVVRRHPVLVRRLRQHRHGHALPMPVTRRPRSGVGRTGAVTFRRRRRPRRRPGARHPVARGPLEPVRAGALTRDAVAGAYVGALRPGQVGHVLVGRAHEPGLAEGARLERAVRALPAVAAGARVGRGAGADPVPGARDLSRAVSDGRDDVAAVASAPLFGSVFFLVEGFAGRGTELLM